MLNSLWKEILNCACLYETARGTGRAHKETERQGGGITRKRQTYRQSQKMHKDRNIKKHSSVATVKNKTKKKN